MDRGRRARKVQVGGAAVNIEFRVPIVPIGKARAHVTARGTFTPTKTRNAEAAVALIAKGAMNGRQIALGRVIAAIEAVMPIPASWSKAKRQDAISSVVRPTGRPDADNISKLVLDACNGIVYADDSQIVDLTVTKFYGTEPGITARFQWGE